MCNNSLDVLLSSALLDIQIALVKDMVDPQAYQEYINSLRVIGKLNDLDKKVVEAGSIHSFKSRCVRAP